MTRDEATHYILAHPAMFKGWTVDQILGRSQSLTDPSFYDPSLVVLPPDPPAPKKPPPKPSQPRPAAPAPVAKANVLPSVPGVPKSVWVVGTAFALALAFRKKIARAVT